MGVMNRYRGTNPALTDRRKLLGREEEILLLEEHIRNGRSAVILGAEGVGKSSLLNCFFSSEYRRKMALQEKLLIRVTDFPTDRDSDGVYQYLEDGVRSALNSLDQPETEEEYERIRKQVDRRKDACQSTAARFQQVCEVIQEFGYDIMLVIDGFERFISSPDVGVEHHNLMNNLISKNLRFVVATNYDFNQESLPDEISGSFLLMKFSGNEICLSGLSEKDCGELVMPGDFTTEEIHQMWILSGGIPAVFRKTAEQTLEQKQRGKLSGMDFWKEVLYGTYAEVSALIARWIRCLSQKQRRVLRILTFSESRAGLSFVDNEELRSAAEELRCRGLLVYPVDAVTERPIRELYKLNSPLLRKLIRDREPQNAGPDGERATEMDEKQLVEMYREWAEKNGYSRPVSFREPVSEELFRQYQLNRETVSRYDEKVQQFIRIGIRVDQTFLDVEMEDHSPCFIAFAKALEAHLNGTLLPLIRKIQPDYSVKNVPLRNVTGLMMGQFIVLLNQRGDRISSFAEQAGTFCKENGLPAYTKEWWEKLRRRMSEVESVSNGSSGKETAANIRNDLAHPVMVSEERGIALLKMMFFGETSLFNSCQQLYDEAVKQGII